MAEQAEPQEQVEDTAPVVNEEAPQETESVVENINAEAEEPQETLEESGEIEEVFNDAEDIAKAEVAEEVEATPETLAQIEQMNSFMSDYSEGQFSTFEEFEESYINNLMELEELREKVANPQAQTQPEMDEFLQGLVQYYNETGDLTPYLEAKTVNYAEMNDEEVMRRNLRNQYPNLTDKNFDRLYEREVTQKYQLDERRYNEGEVELGRELLKAEADKVRSELVENQKNFTAPVKEDNSEQVAQDQQAALEEWTKSVQSNNVTQAVLNDKRVVIDYNGESFAYELDNPQAMVDMTVDNNKFFEIFQGEGGQVDYGKWYKVLNYALDPDTFEKSLIAHGKNLGGSEVVKEIKNPSTPRRAQAADGGNSKEDFLKAALRAMGR